jgi:hypothetical protein
VKAKRALLYPVDKGVIIYFSIDSIECEPFRAMRAGTHIFEEIPEHAEMPATLAIHDVISPMGNGTFVYN